MELTEEQLDAIATEIENGTCVPFLGSAASISSNGYQGPPTGTQLAVKLANDCGYPGADKKNLPKVAQFYEYKKQRRGLLRRVDREISSFHEPSPLHALISKISSKFEVIITTNYDQLMEIALFNAKVSWRPFVQDPVEEHLAYFFPEPDFKGTILYKMHGTIERPGTIVITEDDYIEFLTRLKSDKGIPSYFERYFARYTLLFIGYGLEDLNFKVLFKGIVEPLPRHLRARSYAIQMNPPEYSGYLEDFWKKRGIEILNVDVYEFAHRLADRLGVAI